MLRLLIAALIVVPFLMLLAPVFVVALAIFLFAACVRAIGRMLEPKFVPWAELMTFDRRLGWKPRLRLDTHYLAERDDVFRVVTDGEGWPGNRPLDDSAVVVIGDSFAFGYGVNPGSSFADMNPDVTIKGVGAPGYSMVQSVLLMEQFAERLAGKLVVWFVCLENDLEDNLAPAMRRYRAPFVRPSRSHGEWEIVDTHVNATEWPCSVPGRRRILPHLCAPGPLADRAYTACDYLIARGSTACSRVGAHLVLVTVPDPIQLTASGRARLVEISGSPDADGDFPDRRIAESCQRSGIPFIAGKDHLSGGDYKRREGTHWNEQGHRRIADVLGRLYQSFRSGTLDRLASEPHLIRKEPRVILREFPAGSQ